MAREWAPLHLSVVGNTERGFETVFAIGPRFSTKSAAQRDGIAAAGGTDDFRILVLEGDRLIDSVDAWFRPFEWTEEDYHEELELTADKLGLTYERKPFEH
jgi:hypothetical protein